MKTTFAQAAASYYGVAPDLIARSDINTADDGLMYVTISIAIKDEDLGPIVKRVETIQQAQPERGDPVFIPDDIDLAQMRDDYSALSPAEKGRYGSFARYKSARDWRAAKRSYEEFASGTNEESEGIGGRKVQHVDAPEQQDAQGELPAAVWVDEDDMEDAQYPLKSDERSTDGTLEYLLQVALLTEEQKVKYGVQL